MIGQFIMDNGGGITVTTINGEDANTKWELDRYAVWGDKGRHKPEVIETSNNLEDLQAKWGDLPIIPMKTTDR